MGLRVLITSRIGLQVPSGIVIYVRDLALELQRQGHAPAVFSPSVGAIGRELQDAGVPVADRLKGLAGPPDIIHGHHFTPTLLALRRWPAIPAIHVCHDHRSPFDRTPIHPCIHRHFGVSRVCLDRLIRDGVAPDRARLLMNFVDTRRFLPRSPLPERPRRALVFSNYADDRTHLPAVAEACRRAGLDLDVAGASAGKSVDRPELLLGRYDIVFGKAKAAMEAMAVGTAVVLCDFSGVGPMVTAAQFDELRPLNFGYETLRAPLRPERLLTEIARYDPQDAARVRDRLRIGANLVDAVTDLAGVYREVIAEHKLGQAAEQSDPHLQEQLSRALIRERLFMNLMSSWATLSARQRQALRRVPGASKAMARVKRVLFENT